MLEDIKTEIEVLEKSEQDSNEKIEEEKSRQKTLSIKIQSFEMEHDQAKYNILKEQIVELGEIFERAQKQGLEEEKLERLE